METKFSTEQYQSSYPEGGQYHWWPLARARAVSHTLARTISPGSPVLDVGCGRGIVVDYLRQSGVNCFGVEPAAAQPLDGVAEFITTGLHAEELPLANRQNIETVLLLDVIEHLPDPATFLSKLPESFPQLASVVVTVPARQELWSNYDEYFGHYKRYARPDIKELSDQLNWPLVDLRYFFHGVYVPAWFAAKINRGRATELTPPTGIFKSIHRFVAAAMFFEYLLLPRGLAGTSLLAVFKLS